MVSLQPQQARLRDAAGRSQPVRTRRVRLAGCMGNATKASAEGTGALETFVAPAVLEATRVVCLAPPRQAPLVTLTLTLALALALTLALALALTLTLTPNLAQALTAGAARDRPGHRAQRAG